MLVFHPFVQPAGSRFSHHPRGQSFFTNRSSTTNQQRDSPSSGQLFGALMVKNLVVLTLSWLLIAVSSRLFTLAVKLLMNPLVSAAFVMTVVNFFFLKNSSNLHEEQNYQTRHPRCFRRVRRNPCGFNRQQEANNCACRPNQRSGPSVSCCNPPTMPTTTQQNQKKKNQTIQTHPFSMHQKIQQARRRECRPDIHMKKELQENYRRRVMQRKWKEHQAAMANQFMASLMSIRHQKEQAARRQPSSVPMKIEHSDGFATIKLEVPMYTIHDLDLSFEQGGRLLKIAANYGPLADKARVLILNPETMDISPTGVLATLNDGILTITIARKNKASRPASDCDTDETNDQAEPQTSTTSDQDDLNKDTDIQVETVLEGDEDEDAEEEIVFQPSTTTGAASAAEDYDEITVDSNTAEQLDEKLQETLKELEVEVDEGDVLVTGVSQLVQEEDADDDVDDDVAEAVSTTDSWEDVEDSQD